MSVTESPTSKKWGESSNNQSIQIGDPSGQMLENVEKMLLLSIFGQIFMILVHFYQRGR